MVSEVDTVIITSVSVLSLIGCVFVIAAYYYFQDIQCFAFTLVKDHAIMNLLYSITGILPIGNEVTCQMSAYLLSLSILLVVQWTMVISRILYLKIVCQSRIEEKLYRRRALICVSCISVVCTLLPFTTDIKTNPYGQSDQWCWLKHSDYSEGWEFALSYVPTSIAIVYNLFVSIAVFRAIKRDLALIGDQMTGRKTLIARLFLYPFTLFVCFFPCFCIRIIGHFTSNFESELFMVCSASAPLIGFLNALIYGFTYSVRYSVMRACNCKNQSEIELETSQEK